MRIKKWNADKDSASIVVGDFLYGGVAAIGPCSASAIASGHNVMVDMANAEMERLEKALVEMTRSRDLVIVEADAEKSKLAAYHDACIDRVEALEKERDAARAELAKLKTRHADELAEVKAAHDSTQLALKTEREAHEATKAELANLRRGYERQESEVEILRAQLPPDPAPLPASVEALLWTADGDILNHGACVVLYTSNNRACPQAVAARHNAAIRQAVELTRKDAAPVDDDGRRYRLVYETGQADAGEDFSPGSLFTWRTALEVVRVFEDNPAEANVRAALVPRPVKPKRWVLRVREGLAGILCTYDNEKMARDEA